MQACDQVVLENLVESGFRFWAQLIFFMMILATWTGINWFRRNSPARERAVGSKEREVSRTREIAALVPIDAPREISPEELEHLQAEADRNLRVAEDALFAERKRLFYVWPSKSDLPPGAIIAFLVAWPIAHYLFWAASQEAWSIFRYSRAFWPFFMGALAMPVLSMNGDVAKKAGDFLWKLAIGVVLIGPGFGFVRYEFDKLTCGSDQGSQVTISRPVVRDTVSEIATITKEKCSDPIPVPDGRTFDFNESTRLVKYELCLPDGSGMAFGPNMPSQTVPAINRFSFRIADDDPQETATITLRYW